MFRHAGAEVTAREPAAACELELVVARLEHVEAMRLGPDSLGRALAGAAVAHDWERFPGALEAVRDWSSDVAATDVPWVTYLFLLVEPRTLVGWGGFKGPPTGGEVELGYAVAPAIEGRGIATAAVRELLHIAADDPAVAAVTAHTLPTLGPSTRVLAKAGFVQEGLEDEGGVPVWLWRRIHRRGLTLPRLA